MVADLLQNETVTSIVQKRKEKPGDDSGLESGHTSMNTASDTQSEVNSGSGSGAEDGDRQPQVSSNCLTPDLLRTSQQSQHNVDFGRTDQISFHYLTDEYFVS